MFGEFNISFNTFVQNNAFQTLVAVVTVAVVWKQECVKTTFMH